MVSDAAISDIDKLVAEGLKPTPQDIIRLNALALKMERHDSCAMSLFNLPRVAFLGDVVLPEPTLGHEIWLAEAERICDMDDILTNLSITAYACSVIDAKDLPELDKRKIFVAVEKFKETISGYTPRQIVAATRYVIDGNDATTGEYPEHKRREETSDESDGDFCAAIGVLCNGIAVGLGVSLEDGKKLTRAQLEAMKENALETKGLYDRKAMRGIFAADYFATLDSIKERLRHG